MNRKDEHLNLALKFHKDFRTSDFDNLDFVHDVFPEVNVDEIDLSTNVAGFDLEHPFYINGMTGGSELTKKYNRMLAILARETHTLMGVGSISAALKDFKVADSFTIVREENPSGIIFANLGADKNYKQAREAIKLIDADGIQIHVNVGQEIVMPEGEREFKGWIQNIAQIIEKVDVPVIIKEVGFGMSRYAIEKLVEIGAKTIDISGKGGTNFAKIENTRRKNDSYSFLENFGNSTVVSLLEAQEYLDKVQIIASSGIRNSMDIVKSLSLGANAVAMAGRFITLVNDYEMNEAVEIVNTWKYQIKSIMALLGAKNIEDLTKKDIIIRNEVKDWCDIRGIDYRKFGNRVKNLKNFE